MVITNLDLYDLQRGSRYYEMLNEERLELLLNGGGNQLRVVHLLSGEVREGRQADVVRGISSLDPDAVKQALILSAERRFESARRPAAEILADDETRADVRLRAAVALAGLGDTSGDESTLICQPWRPRSLRRWATGTLPSAALLWKRFGTWA